MNKYFLFILILISATSTFAKDQVECWGRYEVKIPAKVKGNPFDIEFSAVLVGPDTTLIISGFYDGNDTFKLRFMPFKQGDWSYTTQSEEVLLNGLKGDFKCVAPSRENHGPVQVDGQWSFKYADGTRYYPVGTTSYDWMHIANNQPRQTIESLALSKFNKIRMLFFVQNFDPDYPEPEMFPFEIEEVTKDSQGKLVYKWDFSRFNPSYFEHVEWCVDQLAKIGVEADLILFHPYDDGRWGFDRMPMDVNIRYLKYITARMSSFRNIWWSLANEYGFLKEIQLSAWDDFARTVVENDPYSHLCSIHGHTAQYYKYWMPEFSHVSVQDQAPVEGFGRAATVKYIYKKPIVFDEVCYEGNMENRWGSLSGEEYLYRLWQGLIVGTYVTHAECYMDSERDYSRNFLAVGGTFQGEAWKRIGFTRRILEELPNPLELCDNSWDPYTSTAGENYYMIYLGKEINSEWKFDLPARNDRYPRLKGGVRFKVEIIDTWNMTITEYPTIFETTDPVKKYRVYDKNHSKVRLPALPYLLLRITEIKD